MRKLIATNETPVKDSNYWGHKIAVAIELGDYSHLEEYKLYLHKAHDEERSTVGEWADRSGDRRMFPRDTEERRK